jgi:hypothetical protein
MEALALLLGLACVLAAITVVGHGLWLLAAAFLGAFRGTAPPPRRIRVCPGCGSRLVVGEHFCADCGLDLAGAEAAELRSLETTERQLHAFLRGEAIDADTWHRLQECILAWRRALLGNRRLSPAASALGASVTLLLERLLADHQDVEQLPSEARERAVRLYRQMTEVDRGRLSLHALRALARLLGRQAQVAEALDCYRALLATHRNSSLVARLALEAARLAAAHQRTDESVGFLKDALAGTLTRDERQEAEALLWRCRPPAPDAILDVLPDEQPAPVAPAPTPEVRPVEAPAVPQFRAIPVPVASPVAAGSLPAGSPDKPAGRLPAATQERRPRKTVAEVLAAFMEERNILWGELVGGLLIVGCSIALVISLWTTLKEQVPFFPFVVFAGITSVLFGAGLYTLHRWRLHSTSRGLLVIATLLVPLNFLVLAGLSLRRPDDDATTLLWHAGLAAAALALFAVLVRQGARVLTPAVPWALPVAVLGASAGLLLAPRLLEGVGPGSWLFIALAALPVACHGGAGGAVLLRLRRRTGAEAHAPLGVPEAHALFAFQGIATFALVVALGFLIHVSGEPRVALQRLALLIDLASLSLLAGGLMAGRRLTDAPAAAARTAATAVALAAVLVMLLAVVLAWPEPVAVLLVCTLNAVVLGAVAFRRRLPLAHAPALACLALGYLTADYLLTDATARGISLGEAVLSPHRGAALIGLVALLAVASEVLCRRGLRLDGACYAAGAGAIALASLALVAVRGAADPALNALTCGSYVVVTLASNLRWRRPALAYLGLALLVACTLWCLQWPEPGDLPMWALVLAVEAAALGGLAVAVGQAAAPHGAEQRPVAGWLFAAEPARAFWASVPAAVWRDTGAACGALALALTLLASPFPQQPSHTATAAALAAAAFLLAWAYRVPTLTWAGSALLLAALTNGFTLHLTATLPRPWLAALLAHATLALLTSLGLQALRRERWQYLVAGPLGHSALVSSLVAVPLLALRAGVVPAETTALAVYAVWLAALWLVLAWTRRWPLLYAGVQVALTVAVLLAVTSWLNGRPWATGGPRGLHAYGLGVAALGLLSVAVRAGLRGWPRFEELAGSIEPAGYRLALGTVVVVGQLVLAVWCVLPGVLRELAPDGVRPAADAWPPQYREAYGPGAWLLLMALAAVLVAVLRAGPWRQPGDEGSPRRHVGRVSRLALVLGLVLLAITVPVLAAGPVDASLASASALRWGLAGTFLLLSTAVWARRPLGAWASRLGLAPDAGPGLTALVRVLLLGGALVPVLVLTVAVAVVGFGGMRTTGPAGDSFFGRIGWTLSNIVPLAVLSLALVGDAVRERSPGYAFGAGLLANLSLTGGYALAVVTAGGPLDSAHWVMFLQLATCAAAVWALAWSVVGTLLPPLGTSRLLRVQVGMAAAGNIVLIGVALWGLLVLSSDLLDEALAAWIAAAGSLPGWAALALAGAALLRHCRERLPAKLPDVAGLLGLAAVGLLACTVERSLPGWGYRTVLLGWACYALAWSLAGWRGTGREGERDPAAAWAGAAGCLAVLLALKAALVHADQLGAAGGMALVGAAAALTGIRRRREEWVFAAGLALNLAATFVVWHAHLDTEPTSWWVLQLQCNALVSAAVALGWLGLRRHLYAERVSSIRAAPLLAIQVVLGLVVNGLLVAGPLLYLVGSPELPLPPELLPVGAPWGWLALLLAVASACWCAAEAAPRATAHLLLTFALALGVLAACWVNGWDRGTYLSAHVLLTLWLVTALATLAVGVRSLRRPLAGKTRRLGGLLLLEDPATWVPGWAGAVGVLVLTLAVRCTWEDPGRPFWSAGPTLVVAALACALALGWRRALFVYAAGLLVNVAGGMAWVAWGEAAVVGFVVTQVLCLALASALWSAVERAGRLSAPAPNVGRYALPFAAVAAAVGLLVLAVLAAAGLASDLTEPGLRVSGPLTWAALAALVLAFLLLGGDLRPRLTPPAVHAVGLLGIALALHGAELTPVRLGWWAAPSVAAFVLLASLVGWAGARSTALRHFAGLTPEGGARPADWFLPTQAVVAEFLLPLTVWVALAFDTGAERLVGAAGAALLVPAGVLLAGLAAGRWARDLRYATLLIVPVVLAEAGWAMLGNAPGSLALHRTVLALLALALTTWFEGVALVRLLRSRPEWAECARRLGPGLGGLASLVLLAVLVQEALLYQVALRATPMAPWAIALVAAGLVMLMVAGLTFAVLPARDPLGLSERGRLLYVYAAEVLLALLFLHARLTVPQLFGAWGGKYWTFIVMGIAFLGVGLSELFKRRRLPVLAEPLQWTGIFLPLLPLFAFWVKPPAALVEFAHARVPGLVPLLAYLERLPQHFGGYALLWFALGGLYTTLALGKRSFRFALLAALAGNLGLWALLYHYDIAFLAHPQLWLIPLALIGLIAEHLNRERLGPGPAAALRYLALCVLYLSSTADMFITGLGNSTVLPLALAVLSTLGVLGGILARVRAFLFLGVTFLCLVIFSMIWHAAVDLYQTWVWWASGIVLGVAILTLFAVFEKRRQDVVQLLERLQKWQ